MQRLFSALVMVVLASAVPNGVQAAGAYVRKEPIKASMLPSLPSLPSVSVGESFNGCGGRRIRDPNTHQCRGPGDISR